MSATLLLLHIWINTSSKLLEHEQDSRRTDCHTQIEEAILESYHSRCPSYITLRQGAPFECMQVTLFHEGRHTEADIDRRVEDRKEAKDHVARHVTSFFWALRTLASHFEGRSCQAALDLLSRSARWQGVHACDIESSDHRSVICATPFPLSSI